MPLQVQPILPRFGAECSGLDLTKPLSQDEVKQVTDAMDTWGVTVWRNTRMSDEQHVEFSRNFGFLERVPRREGARFRLPFRELFDASNLNVEGEITQDEAAIQYRKGDRLWHTDSAFMEKRTSYSLLLAHEVPPEGGQTWFADTRSAYEDLPQEMKDFLADKVGINSLWWSRKQAGAEIDDAEIEERPTARHPLVHVHRGSGRKMLYIGAHARDIVGMDRDEGRELLDELTAWVTQPQYTFSTDYRAGDMTIWDNLACLHRAGDFDETLYRRDMRRTTIRDPQSPGEPGDVVQDMFRPAREVAAG